MRRISTIAVALAFLLGVSVSGAFAQKGAGDATGIAQRPAKAKMVRLAGKVSEVKSEPCEATTGRSVVGTHLILQTADGKTLNVHLGPAETVKFVTKAIEPGTQVKIEAFQTKKLKKDNYVARSLTVGDRTMELRDKTLRPIWAGQRVVEKQTGKIAVSVTEPSLDAAIEPRFGRCPYFILVDLKNDSSETLKNQPADRGNAGVESTKLIAAKGVKVLLTGKCGPSATRALSEAGIRVVPNCSGTARDVLEKYKADQLPKPDKTTAQPRARFRRGSSLRGGRGKNWK